MRKKVAEQRPLMPALSDHKRAKELTEVSTILDSMPRLLDLVHRDLTAGLKHADRGRDGLTAEQVLRLVVLRGITGLSYEALEFHLQDSASYRAFCRIGFCDGARRSAIQANVKRVTAETLEKINRAFLAKAKAERVETGEKARVDTTVTATNIHPPTDNWQLWDVVRVLTRTMERATPSFDVTFTDRRSSAKSKHVAIVSAANAEERLPPYQELVQLTEETIGDAVRVAADLRSSENHAKLAAKLAKRLDHFVELARSVVHQTRRRVVEGKKVPSATKVVSIFESHTAVIVKDRKHVFYGHKVSLTTGASGLVLDCRVEDGNPGDVTLAVGMIERQKEIYGRAPKQAVFDGGFASRENLDEIKAEGVKDVVFSKGRGLRIADMVRRGSERVYKELRNFRAGIEAGISQLKRAFGLDRCPWRGLPAFKAYVWGSVVAANLLTLARHHLA